MSKYSGLFDIFSPGENCLVYQTREELRAIAESRHVISQIAENIVHSSYSLYWDRYEPTISRTRLLDNILRGTFVDPLEWDDRVASSVERAPWLRLRIEIYEKAQEIHRQFDRVFVDLSPTAVSIVGSDLDDLPRLLPLSARDAAQDGDAVFYVGRPEEQSNAPVTHYMHLV